MNALMERLDNRRMLSADAASINVYGTSLHVHGTDAGDVIELTQNTAEATLSVSVRVPSGATSVPLTATFSRWDITTMHLVGHGGDDVIRLNDVTLTKSGSILGGEGNDVIILDTVNMNGNLYLRGDAGNDTIAVLGGTVEGVSVVGSAGNDDARFDNATVYNYLSFKGGDGDDSLSLVNFTKVFGGVYAQGNDGNDTLFTDDSDFSNRLFFRQFETTTFA